MVILRTRNKITDFFMILAWASPFKGGRQIVKSVFIFSPMLDTNVINLCQIAHKLWLLSLFYPIYHFWG